MFLVFDTWPPFLCVSQDLIPLAASSVAFMVSRSADVNFQKRCLQVGLQHGDTGKFVH